MATNEHSGYPLKWFKDQDAVKNAYECAICLDVLEDAVQIQACGHQFCALCVDDILKVDARCPTCRTELSQTLVFEDQAARRLIKQLNVNCCNEGCSWNGTLGDLLQDHQNRCNFLIQNINNEQSKVEKLEQNLETLLLTVSALENKQVQDVKELKVKHEQDLKDLNLKYKQDIKDLTLRHEKDVKELKLKHEEDTKEIKLKLELSENRLKQLEEKLRKSSEDESKKCLRRSKNPWMPPEKLEKGLAREEKKTAELYRNVMAILNKITPQKFKTLVEQMLALNIDTHERLEGVVERIFEKAIREEMFSVVYANLCRCLFSIKVTDANKKDVSFRKLFLNRCQKEFEKEKEDEQALEEKYSHLEGLPEEERKVKKEEMNEALAKNKRRMLGNVKFIGELFKLKLLTETIMHECLFKLFCAGDEESLECMCKLLSTIGKDLDSDKAKPRIEQYFDGINRIISGKKVSAKVTFILRDVVELRENKWVPRREKLYNPKTIGQIHKKAHIVKRIKGGQGGGRHSPKPTPNDGLITTGKSGKSVAIDQSKLRNKAKQTAVIMEQKQGGYIHPMSMPRPIRHNMCSSSPQGSPLQGFLQPQGVQYQVVGQVQKDPYGQQQMMRTYMSNVQPAYQKRASKLVIRDPKDNSDITDKILHSSSGTANGRSSSTPPLTNSTAQTESSTIQAQFAAQLAALVGEKGKQDNEKKEKEMTEKVKVTTESLKETPNEPKSVLLRPDRETAVKNGASEAN